MNTFRIAHANISFQTVLGESPRFKRFWRRCAARHPIPPGDRPTNCHVYLGQVVLTETSGKR